MKHRLLVVQSHLIGFGEVEAAVDCRVVQLETDIHEAEQVNAGE